MADNLQMDRPTLSVERPSTEQVERGVEHAPERVGEQTDGLGAEKISIQVPVQVPATPPPPIPITTALHREIEKVLEEDMVPLFLDLTPEQRQQFKASGEQTANKIEALLQSAGDVLKEIVRAIREWLTLLPGVNRFFIEREAKIKAEKILYLHKGGG